MSEQKPKRNKIKHASLIPKYNSKIRQEYIDMDYIDKLDDTVKNCKLPNGRKVTEKEYMSIFMKEWNNAGVGKQDEARKNSFERSKKRVKESTDRNNMRNNDTWGKMRAQGRGYLHTDKQLENQLDLNREAQGINSVEDAMIEALDNAKEFADTTDDSE